jgi:hypothetical protein
MPIQHHHLKCETEYFKQVVHGYKNFEFRINDRNFQLFDLVTLHEVVNGEFTGKKFPSVKIKYILYGGKFGLPEGYCIFNW